MNKLKSFVFLLFLGMVLFLPRAGECYVTLKYKDVPAGYYKIRLPYDAYIIEYKWDSMKESIGAGTKVPLGVDIKKSPFNFYQIALNDGQNYRTAWLVCFTSEDKIPGKEREEYFDKLDEAKKAEILKQQGKLRSEIQEALTKFAPTQLDFSFIREIDFNNYRSADGKMEVVMFEWPDVEFPFVNGKQSFQSQIRFAGNICGFFTSMYGKGYAMEFDDRLSAMMFVCFDSEKDFWQPIMDNAVGSVKK